jgi:hypothetical protein
MAGKVGKSNEVYGLITDLEVLCSAARDVDRLIQSGEWCRSSPSFQTRPVLFDRKEPHWLALRQSWEKRVVEELGLQNDFNGYVRAWCYANYPGQIQEQGLWHKHSSPNLALCGVMYLSLPDGSETTLFEKGAKAPSEIGKWFCFGPDTIHRPGQWNPNIKNPRYCLAADVFVVP